MTDAPERIYIDLNARTTDEGVVGTWGEVAHIRGGIEYIRADLLDAHIGAVLEEAAVVAEREGGWRDHHMAHHISRAIRAIHPDALQALERVRREARLEGMKEAMQAASLYNVNSGSGSATARAIVARIRALIEAEKRIAEILPGPTLIDAYGLPGAEADDWDIRVGKLAVEKEGKP